MMNARANEEKEKIRKERAKKAIALAMHSRWEAAVELNQAILEEFPDDLETYNRLGKSLSELGRNREAKAAFTHALEISPHNSIARKNLERLTRLGDETPAVNVRASTAPHDFIEESGKTVITSLVNLASPEVLLKLAPGHPVQLELGGSGLKVTAPAGEYVGQVEPRLATRLCRLMTGGNRYDARATSVGEAELTVIIRGVHKDASQAEIIPFPSRIGADYRVYLPSTMLDYELTGEEAAKAEPTPVKDWSDDDTEPGDDEAFTPVLHRIINTDDVSVGEQEEEGF